MFDAIWWVLLLPIVGALVCAFHSRELGEKGTSLVGCLSILGAFAVSARELLSYSGPRDAPGWTWLSLPLAGNPVEFPFGAYVDGLTLVMLTMITGVAFLIHVYATEYMHGEPDFGRFFASLNLFVATMVCLVLADNLAMLLIGWGGVGYASYSLIGFYSHRPAAVSAARKAFLINVVGDVGLMWAIILVVRHVGSVRYQDLLSPAGLEMLPQPIALYLGLCLLLAAYAKSAQVPLHTWLPDAMEGPTPVSALIHAATMVTAGVYLVVRCHAVFELTPELMNLVAWCGGLTAFVAACAALVQTDLKRILAYSTMSQLGYMFMAAGVGAYGAAIFHLVSHAFFKALLFLAAGAIIHALHGEQDIRKMGGLSGKMGLTQLVFAVGALALAGIPPVTGFWSKEAILASVESSHHSFPQLLWAVALITAFMTAYYIGRAYFLTFHGEPRSHESLHLPSGAIEFPLLVLGVLTLMGGMTGQPITQVMGATAEAHAEIGGIVIAVGLALVGASFAWRFHYRGQDLTLSPPFTRLLQGCFGFDTLYAVSFVTPVHRLCAILGGSIDAAFSRGMPDFLGATGVHYSRSLGRMQSGNLRLYALALSTGVSIFLLFTFICIYRMSQVGGGH